MTTKTELLIKLRDLKNMVYGLEVELLKVESNSLAVSNTISSIKIVSEDLYGTLRKAIQEHDFGNTDFLDVVKNLKL